MLNGVADHDLPSRPDLGQAQLLANTWTLTIGEARELIPGWSPYAYLLLRLDTPRAQPAVKHLDGALRQGQPLVELVLRGDEALDVLSDPTWADRLAAELLPAQSSLTARAAARILARRLRPALEDWLTGAEVAWAAAKLAGPAAVDDLRAQVDAAVRMFSDPFGEEVATHA